MASCVSQVLCVATQITLLNSISQRNNVLVADYGEIKLMNEYFDDTYYKNMPFIITNSEMKNWKIYEDIMSGDIFGAELEVDVLHQTTNCSCFGNDKKSFDLCKMYASTFLYITERDGYEYWYKHERDTYSNISNKYKQCLNSDYEFVKINDIISANNLYQEWGSNIWSNSNNMTSDNNYMKYYTWFNIFATNKYSYNFIDAISLSQYFKLFNLNNGYKDIYSINLFFGASYYRTTRHFHHRDNLIFMLHGNRTLKLSKPSYSIFNLFPFHHQSGMQQYPNYPFFELNNNDIYSNDNIDVNNYHIFDVELHENEILYLPAYWYHEVINSNTSLSMVIWWEASDRKIENSLNYVGLPINLTKYDLNETKYLSLEDIDEFLYFIQNLIDDFCEIINTHKDRNKYPMKCTNKYYNGHSYLLKSFAKIYPILNNINYNNFEWISMQIQMENIFKCSQGKKVNSSNYLDINLLINNFKYDSYFCYDINDHIKPIWNKAIKRILNDYIMKMTNIAISETILMSYLETILLKLTQNTNLIPFWLALQLI
eukprot:86983_1